MKLTVDHDLYFEISQYLNNEAKILDERRFDDWFGLVAMDIKHRMPLRPTRELADSYVAADMSYVEDDLLTLK